MVVAWGETSNEDSKDEAGDEQALMAIGESNDEQEVSVLHLKDKIKFLSKERLSELLLDFIDESEVTNNEKEDLSREFVILKAKCKNLESRANESDSKNAELKNQVLELDTSVLELRSENLKLKLGTGPSEGKHPNVEHEDEAIGQVKDLTEVLEQVKVAPKEGTGDGTETSFVLVGSVKDVELSGLRRSGGKKNFAKEKEREGACGEERGNGKREVSIIYGVAQEMVEESGKKSRGSGSGEAAEGLINLSIQGDEPGSSTEETLADLLKKVGASYDPKKYRTPTPKALSVPKLSKKRKASPPPTTVLPSPKGRATRSRVRQSESDIQKALDESKNKRLAKGKEKVAESSVDVEVEEMEHVHQEEVQPVEVQTPKPIKPKTSSKKSSSMSDATEPSLAKRTRSVVKGKQVKISEDEEWSGEEVEDFDGDKDKVSMFGKRKILKGRLLKDLVEPGMMRLMNALAAQGWKDMVLQMDGRLARNEIIEFMANAEVQEGKVSSLVKGVQMSFDEEKLGEILDIPSEGFDDYTRKMWPCLDSLPTALEITKRFCDAENVNEARAVQKSEMRPQHKVLFEFVNKCLLPK
ncbi:intracellular protein transport protein USO1-like [Nicotiana sylvestris]|uniref:intracellular protein transport protein USO1-like n=1 Tax=Nicotiana sylvestris TaxID=4096 RepID=UPI00388C5ED4